MGGVGDARSTVFRHSIMFFRIPAVLPDLSVGIIDNLLSNVSVQCLSPNGSRTGSSLSCPLPNIPCPCMLSWTLARNRMVYHSRNSAKILTTLANLRPAGNTSGMSLFSSTTVVLLRLNRPALHASPGGMSHFSWMMMILRYPRKGLRGGQERRQLSSLLQILCLGNPAHGAHSQTF